jgi:hypothetical protein
MPRTAHEHWASGPPLPALLAHMMAESSSSTPNPELRFANTKHELQRSLSLKWWTRAWLMAPRARTRVLHADRCGVAKGRPEQPRASRAEACPRSHPQRRGGGRRALQPLPSSAEHQSCQLALPSIAGGVRGAGESLRRFRRAARLRCVCACLQPAAPSASTRRRLCLRRMKPLAFACRAVSRLLLASGAADPSCLHPARCSCMLGSLDGFAEARRGADVRAHGHAALSASPRQALGGAEPQLSYRRLPRLRSEHLCADAGGRYVRRDSDCESGALPAGCFTQSQSSKDPRPLLAPRSAVGRTFLSLAPHTLRLARSRWHPCALTVASGGQRPRAPR